MMSPALGLFGVRSRRRNSTKPLPLHAGERGEGVAGRLRIAPVGIDGLVQGACAPNVQIGRRVRNDPQPRRGEFRAGNFGVRAVRHYSVEVVPDTSGKKAAAVSWKRGPEAGSMATHPGVYCLRTNLPDQDAESLWRTYIMLTDVEAVFRSLKSELGLRPIHHRVTRRAEGHLFITVLAYQAAQVVRGRLAEKGIHSSWATIRETLAGQQRVTASFRTADGRALHIRRATEAEPEQAEIYDALGIGHSPGGVRRTVV